MFGHVCELKQSPKGNSAFKILDDFSGGAVDRNPPANAGDKVQSLIQEDTTRCRGAKPAHATAEPVSPNGGSPAPGVRAPRPEQPAMRSL